MVCGGPRQSKEFSSTRRAVAVGRQMRANLSRSVAGLIDGWAKDGFLIEDTQTEGEKEGERERGPTRRWRESRLLNFEQSLVDFFTFSIHVVQKLW